MEIEIINDNFKKEVLDYDGIVFVDFYANWCMPCKMLAPIVEKVARENNVKLAKVNVDENEDLVREFGIMSIPTLILFKEGEINKKQVGFVPKEVLMRWFD